MTKKILLLTLLLPLMALIFSVSLLEGKSDEKSNIYLSDSTNNVKIGFSNNFVFNYSKSNNKWFFDGVTYGNDKTFIFEGLDDSFYRYSPLIENTNNPETIFNTKIDQVNVLTNTNNLKKIEIKNEEVTLILSVDSKSNFIKREFIFNINTPKDLVSYQLGFALRTNANYILREYGAIATRDPKESTVNIPYAFPAIYTKLYSSSKEYNVINLVDYEKTSKAFGAFRKRQVQNKFEIGAYSVDYHFEEGSYNFIDYWQISDIKSSYYDLIGEAANQLLLINPMPIDDLSNTFNLNAPSFEVITKGLFEDLLDERSGYLKYKGAMKPYGYLEDHGGWAESFVLLDVVKGMLRYSLAEGDPEQIDLIIDLIKNLTNDNGNEGSWIEPYKGRNAKSDEYFLHHVFDGNTFSNNSSGEETGNVTGISGWKYYDMLANLADIATITNDPSIKSSFLKLMPFLNRLKLEDYKQPVAWFYETRLPATGFEDNGSAGNASTWAYIHLVASELSTEQGSYYLDEGLNSLDYANSLDYFDMTAMRTAVKPVVIGWNVRANVLAYKMTNNIKYLNKAKEVVKGLASFYYLNTNPYTFFASTGFGYADLVERWEAYLEMAQSLWLAAPVLEYTLDDTVLLDIMYAASKTYLMAFPINGNPYGNYQRVPGYDSLDGYYIPFEFATGVLTDNPVGGGSQSAYRQVKEIYGSGETFLNYLMFEGYGKATNPKLLLLNTSGSYNDFNTNNQKFTLYNPSQIKENTTLKFNVVTTNNYQLVINGKLIGLYSGEMLKNGISMEINSKATIQVEIIKKG